MWSEVKWKSNALTAHRLACVHKWKNAHNKYYKQFLHMCSLHSPKSALGPQARLDTYVYIDLITRTTNASSLQLPWKHLKYTRSLTLRMSSTRWSNLIWLRTAWGFPGAPSDGRIGSGSAVRCRQACPSHLLDHEVQHVASIFIG